MTVEAAALAVGPAPNGSHHHNSNGEAEGAGVPIDIIDIRRETDGISIIDEIHKGLRREAGVEKRLPTLLLYDEAGLRLFEKITYLDQYYLTNAEISVLEDYADQIAERIADNSVVVELGSGYAHSRFQPTTTTTSSTTTTKTETPLALRHHTTQPLQEI
ncbi:MAG: L-histidine N(alpha)-methyltransferase [Terriglobus roseus]|nr:L-histidine N(alpha)-methyltransferase [Terriglobus roseus]